MADKILVNICISDIPKSRVRTGRDGKQYINAVLFARKEPKHVREKFIETHFLKADLRKDEVLAAGEKEIFGTGGRYATPEEAQNPY